jgi:hypothetical protein
LERQSAERKVKEKDVPSSRDGDGKRERRELY